MDGPSLPARLPFGLEALYSLPVREQPPPPRERFEAPLSQPMKWEKLRT